VVRPPSAENTDLAPINNQIETLFTTALGLQPPWHVAKVELNTGKRRIDFVVPEIFIRAPVASASCLA
jgi:hypothetical protein